MIVECPSCQSRYDVSGRAPGTVANCRCGTQFKLAKRASVAGTLACPRCGANVGSDDAFCQYCAAKLMLLTCPRCFANCFHGYKHCPLCGAGTKVAARKPTDHIRKCPRCKSRRLGTRLISDVCVDECEKCLGLFLDAPTIERVLSERSLARAESILGALPKQQFVEPSGVATYIHCPDCLQTMNRKLFARGAGVILDVCRKHGTWFDQGELPRVVEFVMAGGLEAANKRELDEARAKVREQARSTLAMGTTHEPTWRGNFDAAGAIFELFTKLWK